jgi:hypothetical protein
MDDARDARAREEARLVFKRFTLMMDNPSGHETANTGSHDIRLFFDDVCACAATHRSRHCTNTSSDRACRRQEMRQVSLDNALRILQRGKVGRAHRTVMTLHARHMK